MFQTLDNKVYNHLCFCWRILFSSGCRFRKTLLGVPSDHRIFPKRFLLLPLPGGQHFPFHLIARYHNRAGRPTDIGSAISGSGATDGIAALFFLCFPGFWRTGPFSGFVVAVIVRGPDANAFASWSGQDVPRPLQSMPSRRAITSAACIPRVSRPIPWVFP